MRIDLIQAFVYLQVPSEWCQVQALITANTETLTPAYVRCKASIQDHLRPKDKWYRYNSTNVVTTTPDQEKRVLHHHVYNSLNGRIARKAFLNLAIDVMQHVTLKGNEADGTLR